MTPAPLQVGQAPSELALNSAGFTPLAFANALRIGSSRPVYVAGLLRREPLIADWSTETTPGRGAIEPLISELLPEPATPAAHKILERLVDVGLGYVSLGQPLPTLSGGERQRLKLATHMSENGGTYVLDEPTSGLHLADVENLLGLLDRLVDSGKSVIVIEHHPAVMAHADWLIDLGPGAGHDGGRIVFEGTPSALVADGTTLTGKHLAGYVGR